MQAWLRCFLLVDDLNFGHCFSRWRKISKNMQDPPHQSHVIFFSPGPATPPPPPPASHEQPTSAAIAVCGQSVTTPASFHWAACTCCTLIYFILWAAFCERLWPPLSGCFWLVLLFLPWEAAVDWLGEYYLFRLPVFICSVILVGMIFLQSALFCSWSSFLPFLIYSQFKA